MNRVYSILAVAVIATILCAGCKDDPATDPSSRAAGKPTVGLSGGPSQTAGMAKSAGKAKMGKVD